MNQTKFVLSVLILIVICLSGCGKIDESDTANSSTTDSYMSMDYSHKTPVQMEAHFFRKTYATIVEWGNSYELAEADGIKELKEEGYRAFLVKYIDFFESTGKITDISFSLLSDASILIGTEPDDELLSYYDDILFIPKSMAESLKKGDRALIFADCFVNLLPESSLTAIPVIDNKLVLNTESFADNGMVRHAFDANGYLTDLGHEDKIFRDGMTVEELEEYFNLVTKTETFAPLFVDSFLYYE